VAEHAPDHEVVLHVGFFWCGFVLMGVTFPMFAILKGELIPGPGHVSLLDGIAFQLFSRKGSGGVFDPSSPAHEVLRSWADQDPLFLAAGVLSVFVGVTIRRLREPALAGIFIVLVALQPGGYLPAMYVIQALPISFALCLAGMVQLGVDAARSDRNLPKVFGYIVTGALLVAAAVAVAPRWFDQAHIALTASSNEEYAQLSHWARRTPQIPRALASSWMTTCGSTWRRSGSLRRPASS
jgi:hypothetical protein